MDYLDELIEISKAESPEFAKLWDEGEAKHQLALMRKNSGLTQQEVADRMGVARPRVAELEANPGRCSYNRIRAYVKALGGEIKFEGSVQGSPSTESAFPVVASEGKRKAVFVRERRKGSEGSRED